MSNNNCSVAPRFTPVVARAEAFLDAKTGLMWDSQDAAPEGVTHEEALKAVQLVRAGGFTDWRLPTVDELNSIVDRTRYEPAADPLLNLKSQYYWTSTPDASDPGCAWFVAFGYGYVGIYNRYYRCRVRAVRSAAPASQ